MIDTRNVEAFCDAKNQQNQQNQLNQTATASGIGNFSGFAVKTFQFGTDYIDADRFELEYPFLIFFKGIKQVALRGVNSIERIDAR